MSGFSVAALGDIPNRDSWIPVRDHLGISAFGVNAYRATEAGGRVISDHTETMAQHEELYLVVEGHATFTVDGDEIDAPQGTFVFVGDVTARRGAVAKQEGTTVLVAGARPGHAFEVSPWEESWAESQEAMRLYREQRYGDAATVLREAVEHHPDSAGLHYNLACFESMAGVGATTVAERLGRAVELYPGFKEFARADSDFDPVRDDPAFQALVDQPAAEPAPAATAGPSHQAAHLEDIEVLDDGRCPSQPVRHHFGITSFGATAWTAPQAGDRIINEHDESEPDSDEELYAVVAGHARFELDGEQVHAPAGTLVFAPPGVKRTAFAEEAGTSILVLGGIPGKAFEPFGWEVWAPLNHLYAEGRYAEAADRGRELIEAYPQYAGPLYNVACCESLAGRKSDAIEHLRRAIELTDGFRVHAESDSDFDPIRDEPAFQELMAPRA